MIETPHAERLRAKAAPFAMVEDAVLQALRRLRVWRPKLRLISNCSQEEVAAWWESTLCPLFDDAVFSYDGRGARLLGDPEGEGNPIETVA